MILDDHAWAFLDGRNFSNGDAFPVAGNQPVISRNDLLVQLSQGKRVLHVGCADHTPLIASKRAAGNYLHDLLTAAAESVIGLDVEEDALTEMERLGITNLYTPETLPPQLEFDIVLVPDVIEHIPDVGTFLGTLTGYGVPVVVTTPNAMRLRNRRLWGSELINTDHRYWFSPYTLAKSLNESGLRPDAFWYTDNASWGRGALRRPWEVPLKRRFPLCRDGLAIQALPRL